ncbi:MAG TPA: RnfABCDGE type electron transport complex subunit D [Phycisphaerae bacterium]|nr:RnfABCDGE type electron transport complex subunit D [Phycisphaerae bacterium]
MSDTPTNPQPPAAAGKPEAPKGFLVSSAPHLADGATTRRIMFDVVIGMIPLLIAATLFFKTRAVAMTLVTVAACLATEAVANYIRGRKQDSLFDGSAIVTGMILAFSLPPALDLYMAAIGGAVAIALAKAIFGGLGQNLFNPAMVGRAFLMICFPAAMGIWTEPVTLHRVGDTRIEGVTMATPLGASSSLQKGEPSDLPRMVDLFTGEVSGSLGETSALAALIGGLYLVFRRTADWRPVVGMLGTAVIFAVVTHWADPARFQGPGFHLMSGALLFGAFFIATDYVGAPITPLGRWIFGIGVGTLVMLIRLFGAYPEGVMFAILIMNSLTPLIERWTVPAPFGGHVPAQAAK